MTLISFFYLLPYVQNIQDQPFSLPVTLDEFERINDPISLLKGMLWQKKDRIFSRWKERFFMLTSDYLNCYEKNPQSIADASLFKAYTAKYLIFLTM